MNYLGIDNGISGGLCCLDENGRIECMRPMPVQKTRKGNEVDVLAIHEWLEDKHIWAQDVTVVIEEPGGSKSASACASMAGSFHALRALFEIGGFKLVRITPAQWQRPMLKCAAGDTKPVALQLARSLWPCQSWLATEKSRVPHEGLVDAALIGEFARRNNL